MSRKLITIINDEKETILDINLEETNSYDLLMAKVIPLIKDYNPSINYNLYAINTKEDFTLLDEQNYMNVMKEDSVKGDILQLYIDKKIINSQNDNNENNDDLVGEKDNDNENGDKKENENENFVSIEDIEIQLKIDENINKTINDIINDDNEDENIIKVHDTTILFNKIKNRLCKEKTVLYRRSNSMHVSRSINEYTIFNNIKGSFIYNHNIENSNIIHNNNKNDDNDNDDDDDDDGYYLFGDKDDNDDVGNKNNNYNGNHINEIQTSNYINQDNFKTEICSLCGNNLQGVKYICSVCENCILCTNCEIDHFHPCIKFKTEFLSNLPSIYRFISKKYGYKKETNNKLLKLFKKEYEIKMRPLTDGKVCLRPNKMVKFPIELTNLTKETINSTQFDIIPKDNKLVQIYFEAYEKLSIKPKSNTIKLKCISGGKLGKEKINFYLFSRELTLKNSGQLNFCIEFEINDDMEEEEMNKNLKFNENVILYSKDHKRLALKILDEIGDNNRSEKHIKEVFDILIDSKWDKNIAIKKIISLKINQ